MGNQPKTEQAEKNLFMKMTALRGKNRVSLTVPAAAALLPPQLYDLRGSTGQRYVWTCAGSLRSAGWVWESDSFDSEWYWSKCHLEADAQGGPEVVQA